MGPSCGTLRGEDIMTGWRWSKFIFSRRPPYCLARTACFNVSVELTHLLEAMYLVDLVKRVHRGRQARVWAEELVLNDGGEGQVVEQVGQHLPNLGRSILAQALFIETVAEGRRG